MVFILGFFGLAYMFLCIGANSDDDEKQARTIGNFVAVSIFGGIALFLLFIFFYEFIFVKESHESFYLLDWLFFYGKYFKAYFF